MTKLYSINVFGWDTNTTAKVAIAQLKEERVFSEDKCPKALLIHNQSIRWQPNILKILGYIPVINVVVGIAIISEKLANADSDNTSKYNPNYNGFWKARAVAMIFCGPLLLVVDLIVHLHHLRFAKRYSHDHANFIQAFNTTHNHSEAHWPGHPIFCEGV